MLSILLLTGLLATSIAQETRTTSFFLLNTDPQSLVASVISVDATATTYEMTCPSGTDQNDCGYFPPVHIVQENSNTWIASMATADSIPDFTFVNTCSISGSIASCYESYGGASANFPGETTTTYQVPSDADFYPVTITAGLDKLAAATQASGPTPTTAVMTSQMGTSASVGSKTGTAPTSSPTGAGVKIHPGSLTSAVALAAVLYLVVL